MLVSAKSDCASIEIRRAAHFAVFLISVPRGNDYLIYIVRNIIHEHQKTNKVIQMAFWLFGFLVEFTTLSKITIETGIVTFICFVYKQEFSNDCNFPFQIRICAN